MKAAVITGHGELDKVAVAEVPQPKPGPGEVLIRVKCAALNHLDIWVRKGGRAAISMPHVLGSDAAGVVSEVGAGVSGVAAGAEVVINPGLSCGCCEYCARGEESECTSFGLLGMNRAGTFAEYVTVPAVNVYPKPSHLDFRQAAAIGLVYVTAWRMLMTRAGMRTGETILVHGIGGGVATAALQLAKLAGAVVIVTSSSEEKLRRAEQMGADYRINYKAADVAAGVREITGSKGVDIVVDTVGAATWGTDLAAVRRGGRIVLCGVTGGAKAETNLQALYWNQVTVYGSTMGSNEDFRAMLSAVCAAKLEPVIDSVVPLGQVRQAMARMENGEQFGKIVLEVEGN